MIAPVGPSRPDAQVSGDSPTARPGSARVLLVDDHNDSREVLRLILELLGYTVLEAADGPEGVRVATAGGVDVAVVDIGLPGFDGYEVARRLRAHAVTRELPLIALTGYGQADDRRRALEAGFDQHLVKPVNEARLVAAITSLLESR